MGDPKFPKRRYDRPTHPWRGDRIAEERVLCRKYGLKNKRELWKMQSALRSFRGQARSLQAKLRIEDAQAVKETDLLLARLVRLGLLKEGASSVNEVLGLSLDDVLGRRFQSVIYYKGLARSMKQARQFIVHGHVSIAGRRVTIPGYFVRRDEEELIEFHPGSVLKDDSHPMRRGEEADEAEAGGGGGEPAPEAEAEGAEGGADG